MIRRAAIILTHKVFGDVRVDLIEEVEVTEIPLFADVNKLPVVPVNHVHTICFSLREVT